MRDDVLRLNKLQRRAREQRTTVDRVIAQDAAAERLVQHGQQAKSGKGFQNSHAHRPAPGRR